MHQSTAKSLISFLFMSLISMQVGATLIDRGNGLIYDNVLDITWLQNANLAAGSVYDQTSNGSPTGPVQPCCSPTDGLMTWENAMAWAENLAYQGYDDWRLPNMEIRGLHSNGSVISAANCMTEPMEDCITNEYGYMHRYNLGAEPPTFGPESDRTGNLFSVDGIRFDSVQGTYWTSTEWGTSAWAFRFDSGGFGSDVDLDWEMAAWAVRDGDSMPGGISVPEPSSLLLMVMGFLALGLQKVRKKRWIETAAPYMPMGSIRSA